MQVIFDLFNTVFLAPLINLLVFLINTLQYLGIPGALGFSIIILTLLIRLVTWPAISRQLKSAKKMADLKPHMDELKKKHAGDKQAFAKAQMQLYKEHGVNPAAGCLPTLIQFPILIALYQAIFAFFSGPSGLKQINEMLYFPVMKLSSPPDPNFLGINLTYKPAEFVQHGYLLLLIPLLTAVLTFIQSKMIMPKPVKKYPSDLPKEMKEKEKAEDAMSAIQGQMVYMMPVMIGFFSWQFPTGLSVYWNMFTLIGIIQQYLLSGWGGMDGIINRLRGVNGKGGSHGE
ncbi:YidC/Oxa1 family membrane protein insertase [Candidatus Daviesbacteria bacterium]|nr:YidC/Oxa1 family membrane protein insertase [Candidatus Daviesbacteria bacterium]